ELIRFAQTHVTERAAAPKEVVILDRMPLTDVGKPAKIELRLDAARRAFVAVLADVTKAGANIDVVPDPAKGMVLHIDLNDIETHKRGEVELLIREQMIYFPISYVIR